MGDRSGGAGAALTVVMLALAVLAPGSCGSDGKTAPGAMCALNTDCYSPLVCAYGRCHAACRSSRDCPSGHDCVLGPEAPVCQLESICHYRSECERPLECALDRKCRSQCKTDLDCPGATQKCVMPDKVCAEPADIDVGGGRLKNAQLLPVPDRPDAGDAGAPGSDAAADGGDGPVLDAPEAPTDAEPAVDLTPTGEPGACGFPEVGEPNDLRETATALPVGAEVAGCIASGTDTDFYELTGPAAGPGYFQVSLVDVGAERLRAQFFTASDNNLIHDPLLGNVGGSLFFYFSAAPGQKYRVQLARLPPLTAPFRYTVRVAFTAVNDVYEPNDTRATAATITAGVPATAYMFSGFTVGQIPGWIGRQGEPPYADWYKVTLAPGTATIKVENAAADVRPVISFYDSLGRENTVGRGDGGWGAGTTATVPIPTADTYHVLVTNFPPGSMAAGVGMTVSPSFTMPYTITVSQ
jgi:hypothetical protein